MLIACLHGFLHRADLDKKEEEIKKLKDMHPAINKGKGLMKVQNRQRRQKMAALKENTKEALAFTESYEVDLKSISFETRESQPKMITLNYTPATINSGLESSSTHNTSLHSTVTSSISNSPQLPQQNCSQPIAEILYLLDTYGVSDDFYHELSMINTLLPRSHEVKKLRKFISSGIEIQYLQHPYFGCYVSFPEYLSSTLTHLCQSGCILQSPIEVKISGDGAPFYRSSSFIILSFSFPTLDPDSLSATGMPKM